MKKTEDRRQKTEDRQNSLLIAHCSLLFVLVSYCLLLANDSFAGDYHKSGIPAETTLACAQCHIMHGTQGSVSLIYSGGINTYAKLLRSDSVVNLCKYCHDGDPFNLGAPDLFSPIYNASAGDFNTGGTPDEDKRHSIGVDLAGVSPPGYVGSDWTTAQTKYGSVFSCIYCHDQHGNGNYRNFRPEPLDPSFREPGGVVLMDSYKIVTYNNGIWDNVSSIVQAVIDGNGDGSNPASQYSTSNMTFRSSTKQIAGFCGKCHVKFYNSNGYGGDDLSYGTGKLGGSVTGDSGTDTQWVRHPVGKISVGVGNGHTVPANFASITGVNRVRAINPDGLDSGGDEQPFCLTCHRSHGSPNHSNLIFGSPTASGGAGTMMRDTCQQCHNQ
ncbi:MAG TPA: hypothetical protein DCY98_07515 [Nitrospinae bacterium]|nr:hypothetical protein [Nitrospinota bacterium]